LTLDSLVHVWVHVWSLVYIVKPLAAGVEQMTRERIQFPTLNDRRRWARSWRADLR
jgi:hypothetical protein